MSQFFVDSERMLHSLIVARLLSLLRSYKNNAQCEIIQHCFVHSPVLQCNKVELNAPNSLPNYYNYLYENTEVITKE